MLLAFVCQTQTAANMFGPYFEHMFYFITERQDCQMGGMLV
jgi:hypothetical protein